MEKKGRVLAVDFGTKKIGLAMSDENCEIAQPFCVLKREGTKKDIEKISGIVRKYNVSVIVVGLPFSDSGHMTRMAEKAKLFGEMLSEKAGKEVVFLDETMTSSMAEEVLIQGGMRRDRRKETIDKVAAAIILQDFLRRKG